MKQRQQKRKPEEKKHKITRKTEKNKGPQKREENEEIIENPNKPAVDKKFPLLHLGLNYKNQFCSP